MRERACVLQLWHLVVLAKLVVIKVVIGRLRLGAGSLDGKGGGVPDISAVRLGRAGDTESTITGRSVICALRDTGTFNQTRTLMYVQLGSVSGRLPVPIKHPLPTMRIPTSMGKFVTACGMAARFSFTATRGVRNTFVVVTETTTFDLDAVICGHGLIHAAHKHNAR